MMKKEEKEKEGSQYITNIVIIIKQRIIFLIILNILGNWKKNGNMRKYYQIIIQLILQVSKKYFIKY